MKTNILLLVSFLQLAALSCEACPNIAGAYFLDSSNLPKVNEIAPSSLPPGACAFAGDSDEAGGPKLVEHLHWLTPQNYPKGVRIYLYSLSADNCQYAEILSYSDPAHPPVLDMASYQEVQQDLPATSEDFYIALFNKNLMGEKFNIGSSQGEDADGAVTVWAESALNQPSHDNGSFGIHVTSSYSESIKQLPNGDLLTQTQSSVQGTRFGVIPIHSQESSACRLKKL